MNLYPKYVTVDDFKNFTGIDLAAVLRTDDNESNQAERFLLQTEDHLMTWIDRNTFRVLDYDRLNPAQLENFKKAILSQALYTYRNGAIALGLESGYDSERGIVTDPDKLAQLEVCQSAINYLTTAGLYNLNVKNRPRVLRGYPGLEGISFDGGGLPDPNPDLIGFNPNDYVTLDTDQNIQGQKYFAKDILLGDNVGIKNGANYLIYYDATNDATSFSKTIIPGEDATYNLGKSNRRWNKLFIADKINQNESGFGILMPNTSGYNANKTLATTDELGNATKIRGVDLPENPDTPITPRVLTYNPDNTISWIAGGSGGMYNPMTTPGDMIVGSTNGEPVRLAKGTAGQVLVSGSSAPEWQTLNVDYTGGNGINVNASSREISADTSVLETKTNAASTYETKTDAANIREVAEGKCKSYVINTQSEITGTKGSDDQYTNVTAITGVTIADLKLGDVILIKELDKPDYWVSALNVVSEIVTSVSLNKLETSKVDLTGYYTKSQTNGLLSDEYDNTATYSVGDYCIYNNTLYRCTTAVTVAEDFDNTKWTACKIADVMVDLTSAQTITGDKTFNGNVIFNRNSILYLGDLLTSYIKNSGNNNLYYQAIWSHQFRGDVIPWYDGLSSLGGINPNTYGTKRWLDLWLLGKLKDGTNEVSVAQIHNGLYGGYATNSTTELKYETINNISVSANTTYTLANAPTGTYPEYKANITNTDTANAITITLPSGTIVKAEPGITVSSNTFTIPADTTVIVSIQDGLALVMIKG